MRIEDIIPDEKVVITISHAGYIKRTKLSDYKIKIEAVLVLKHLQPEIKIF